MNESDFVLISAASDDVRRVIFLRYDVLMMSHNKSTIFIYVVCFIRWCSCSRSKFTSSLR